MNVTTRPDPTRNGRRIPRREFHSTLTPASAAAAPRAFSLLLRFLGYFSPYKKQLLGGFVALMFSLVLSLVQPIISKAIIDNALLKRDFHLLNLLGLSFMATALLTYVIATTRQYVFIGIQQKVMTRVKKDLAEHLLRVPLCFHERQNPGYLLTRVDADVGNLAGVMTDKYIHSLVDLLTCVGAGAIILVLNWRLALVSMAVLPFFTYAAFYFGKQMRASAGENRELHAQVAARLQDLFQSTLIIKIFGRELGEVRVLVRSMHAFVRSIMKMTRISLLGSVSMGCIATLAPLAVIWYGGYQVIRGELSIGALFAFNMYLAYLFTPLKSLFETSQSVQTSIASLQRIYELFDTPSEEPAERPRIRLGPDDGLGEVQFQDVSFAYRPGEQVLRQLSFRVRPRSMVAIVGPTGAGKTSIFRLILRLYEPQQGRILLDGIDVKLIALRDLRSAIRMVPQEDFLLNRSIRENIRFGASAPFGDAAIPSSAQACVGGFVDSLPEKYDSVVGQRGTTLSGGERQRISIARALSCNPKILLLDESTAFLDANTEAMVQDAIVEAMKGRTCLVIAHRLATVVNADHIIVLDHGGIVDQGTHEELYARCRLYASLCDKQFRWDRCPAAREL